MSGVSFRLNGRNVVSASPAVTRLSNVLRDEFRATGTKVGLRRGRLRRLHGADRWRARLRLPRAGCSRPRADRVVTIEGLAAHTATGQALQELVPRAGRRPMRHLHAGHAGGGRRLLDHESSAIARAHCRCAGRRPLPLHGLFQDHRCDCGRGQRAVHGRHAEGRQGGGRAHRAPRRASQGCGSGGLWCRCHSAGRAVCAGHPLALSPRPLQLRRP